MSPTVSSSRLPLDDHDPRTCRHPDGSWWVNDAQGIPLCRVCDRCKDTKLASYRPEILTGYDQTDVDEPIDGDGDWRDLE